MRATMIAILAVVFSLSARSAENFSAEALLGGHQKTDAYSPVAAFGSDVYLVVWEAGRNEGADIVGLRIDKAGRPLDAAPFVISAAKDEQVRPRVVFGGGNFLVVWQDLRNGTDYDLYAARVSPEGKVLDPQGIAVAAGKHNQAQAAICFDGKVFHILWRDMRDGKEYDIYGGRLGMDGRPLDGAGALVFERQPNSGGGAGIGVPGIGVNGKGEVVAGAYKAARVAARRGTQTLGFWQMRNNQPVGETAPLIARGGWAPMFASDGTGFLAVFTTLQQSGRGGVCSDLGGAALLKLESWGKPMVVVLPTEKKDKYVQCVRNPSVAWNGKTYVVAWDVPKTEGRRAHRYDVVFLRRVSKDGKPLDKETLVAGERGSPACHSAVASDGAGTTLIAYERHPKTGAVPIKIAFRLLRAK